MGIFDSIVDTMKGAQYKAELDQLQKRYEALLAMMTPEQSKAHTLQNTIQSLEIEKAGLDNRMKDMRDTIDRLNATISQLDADVNGRKNRIYELDEELVAEAFGLYKPHYDFASALIYKDKLTEIRAKQKALIKQGRAVTGHQNWTVNNSIAKGRKMVSDCQKLFLRAFNTECDDIINRVKYTNYDKSVEKIHKSAESIEKLGTMLGISITHEYLKSKIKELKLAFEYRVKKQEEKEEQKEARAQQREAARVQRELDEQRRKLEKEQTHYQTAFSKICAQLEADPDNAELVAKKDEMQSVMADIEKAMTDIDYRQANAKAGYVYIISNIGAFGDNVYKIGMTRRLDPQERVDELGDASVPFNFDVHAMIFSEDAPALEAALHRAFEDRKLNMVNTRREFFRVSLDEIKEVVKKNFDKTVEFIDFPDAEQYRVSEKMRAEHSI